MVDADNGTFEAVIKCMRVLEQVLGINVTEAFNQDPVEFVNTLGAVVAEGYISLEHDTMRILSFTEINPAAAIDGEEEQPPLPREDLPPPPPPPMVDSDGMHE